MFLVPRRQIWTSQPQGAVNLDCTNDLTRSLEFVQVGAHLGKLTNTGSTTKPTRIGIARAFSGSSQYLSATNATVSGPALTFFALARRASTVENNALLSVGGSGGSRYLLYFIPDGGVALFSGQDGGYSQAQSASTAASDTSRFYFIVGRVSANNSRDIWVDGQQVVTDTTSTSVNSEGIDKIAIGSYYTSGVHTGGFYMNGDIALSGAYSRALSDADIRKISSEPWQIFKRPDSRIFVPVSAGGGTTTVTSDSTASYKLQGSVQASASAAYDIRTAIQADSAASYAIRSSVQQSATPSYAIRAAIQQDTAANYLIQGAVDQVIAASFAIRSAISGDASATYNILSATEVSSSTSAGYNIRGGINQDTAASYALRGSITQDTAASYALRGSITQDSAASYALRGSITQDSAASYALRGSITQDTSATYSILSASSVSSSATAGYAIKGSVESSIVAGYSIAQAVQAEVAASYIIRSGVVSEAQAAYIIRGLVQQTIAASYAIEGSAFTGSISDADIARIVQAVLSALNATTIPVDVHKVLTIPVTGNWPTANENADALLARNWP